MYISVQVINYIIYPFRSFDGMKDKKKPLVSNRRESSEKVEESNDCKVFDWAGVDGVIEVELFPICLTFYGLDPSTSININNIL